jgi:hypothetical protein
MQLACGSLQQVLPQIWAGGLQSCVLGQHVPSFSPPWLMHVSVCLSQQNELPQ